MYKNTKVINNFEKRLAGFNPCFNGSMYKNEKTQADLNKINSVSILVLMDLCIKTCMLSMYEYIRKEFQSLF